MPISHLRTNTKPSGGRLKTNRKKRKYELAGIPAHTRIGKKKWIPHRMIGGSNALRLLLDDTANVYDPQSKKMSKAKIKTVVGNPANRHFVRRNILTKGSEIDTELGKAKVTSRPSRDGTVNAVLIK